MGIVEPCLVHTPCPSDRLPAQGSQNSPPDCFAYGVDDWRRLDAGYQAFAAEAHDGSVEVRAPTVSFVEHFGITPRELDMVERRLSNLYQKLGIQSPLQLVNLLRSERL